MRVFEIPLDPVVGCDPVAEIYKELQSCLVERVEVDGSLARVFVSENAAFSEVIHENLVGGVRVAETVHHSAALRTWLRVSRMDRPLVVIHIDSHNDLGSPNLICSGNGSMHDRWTGEPVDPHVLATVKSAIDSSAIEIGSFLTAAMVWLPVAAIVWISPSPERAMLWGMQSRRSFARIERNTLDRMNKTLRRLSVQPGKEEPGSIPIHVSINGEGIDDMLRSYGASSDFIVGIDYDYFDCSLEDGGSAREPSDTASLGWRPFDFFVRVLSAAPKERIVCVTAARSPGFCCPSVAEQCSRDLRRALACTMQ